MKLKTLLKNSLLFLFLFQLSSFAQKDTLSVEYNSFERKIKIPKPSKALLKEFNAGAVSKEITVKKENGKVIKGYKTTNKKFVEKVITPIIKPYLAELGKMKPAELINTLALFEHELFSIYIGKDFYRWGGDIFDRDDPQNESIRYKCKYGLDCSGFSASAYDLAVYYGLIKIDDEAAIFSSKGFEYYCKKTKTNGPEGTDAASDNYRLNTRELAKLGREVFKVEKGAAPTESQINLLQPGDLVGRDGHFGIVVFINNKPYYLESGGYVLPVKGGLPYPAANSIQMFAKDGPVFIRRSLPDPGKDMSLISNLKRNSGKEITVEFPDTTFSKEGIYNIPVKVSNFNNIGAISLSMTFDTTVVRYKGLENAPKNMIAGNPVANLVNIGWFDVTGKTPINFGTSDLVYIRFQFLGKGSTKLNFVMSMCEIANGLAQPINITYYSGKISSVNEK